MTGRQRIDAYEDSEHYKAHAAYTVALHSTAWGSLSTHAVLLAWQRARQLGRSEEKALTDEIALTVTEGLRERIESWARQQERDSITERLDDLQQKVAAMATVPALRHDVVLEMMNDPEGSACLYEVRQKLEQAVRTAVAEMSLIMLRGSKDSARQNAVSDVVAETVGQIVAGVLNPG